MAIYTREPDYVQTVMPDSPAYVQRPLTRDGILALTVPQLRAMRVLGGASSRIGPDTPDQMPGLGDRVTLSAYRPGTNVILTRLVSIVEYIHYCLRDHPEGSDHFGEACQRLTWIPDATLALVDARARDASDATPDGWWWIATDPGNRIVRRAADIRPVLTNLEGVGFDEPRPGDRLRVRPDGDGWSRRDVVVTRFTRQASLTSIGTVSVRQARPRAGEDPQAEREYFYPDAFDRRALAGMPPLPAKYQNLVLLTPMGAERSCLQLAPVARITSIVPPKTRSSQVHHAGLSCTVDLDFPRLAWSSSIGLQGDGQRAMVGADCHLFRAEVRDGRYVMAHWRGANVFDASNGDRVCWGRQNPPASLREAHSMFFRAPFNSDLWPDRERPHSCPVVPPHRCATAQARSVASARVERGPERCPIVHACRDGQHASPHLHTCFNARRRQLDGSDARCAVRHAYPRMPSPSSLSARRAAIKTRSLHLTTEDIARFRVTLRNVFQDETRCPCVCCVGACDCPRCPCCTPRPLPHGHHGPMVESLCNCTRCPCEPVLDVFSGRALPQCSCTRACACCNGQCRCQRCQCDKSQDFVRWLKAYQVTNLADRQNYVRGERFCEAEGAHDGFLLTSDEATMDRFPPELRTTDASGYECLVATVVRSPDGSFNATAGGTTVNIKREECTL